MINVLLWLVIAAVLLFAGNRAAQRALLNKPDYRIMQAEARYVWEHGRTAPGTLMFGYLPFTTFYLWPCMVWLPHRAGIYTYAALNLGYAAAAIWLLRRWWHAMGPPRRAPLAALFAWPVLMAVRHLEFALGANQVTLVTLVLCVAGVTLVAHRRSWSGGALLGLAGLMKLLPFVLVGLLVLRRRWAAVGGVAVAVLLFEVVPSLLFFGPGGAIAEYRAWRDRTAVYSSFDAIEQPLRWAHAHRSDASCAAVLTRWLRKPPEGRTAVVVRGEPPTGLIDQRRARLAADEYLVIDPTPPRDGRAWAVESYDTGWAPRFALLDLPAEAVKLVYVVALSTAGLALVMLTCTGQAWGDSQREWFALSALWMLAMFVVTPLMRPYYLSWALPAVVVVYKALLEQRAERPGRWTPGMVLAAVSLVMWMVGVAGLGWEVARWYGLHLLVLALLAASTAWACRLARSEHERDTRPAVAVSGGTHIEEKMQ